MQTAFPQAVPEIPVSNVEQAAGYYVNVLGFTFDWGDDDGGIGGISQGDCRMFLTNEPFRAVHGPKSPVIVWLNLNSKQEVDELFERWKHAGAYGDIDVAQVDRQGCALILAEHWPEKAGKALMFISLNVEPETGDAEVAALDALRAELESRGVAVKEGHWGYRVLVVEDPDGNQLFLNYPNEPGADAEGLRRT